MRKKSPPHRLDNVSLLPLSEMPTDKVLIKQEPVTQPLLPLDEMPTDKNPLLAPPTCSVQGDEPDDITVETDRETYSSADTHVAVENTEDFLEKQSGIISRVLSLFGR